MTRTIRQIPRISGVDPRVVKILEPMRDAIEQLTVGAGRALRVPDIGDGLAFKSNKLVSTVVAIASTEGGVTQAALDDLAAQINALISSQQQFRAFIEQQVEALSVVVSGLNGLELDVNGYVTGISGSDVPGDVDEVPVVVQSARFGITRTVEVFDDGTAYSLGDFVIPSEAAGVSTGLIYEVTVAGTAGAEPDWLTANDPGETVTSGAVTFTARTPQVLVPFIVGAVAGVALVGIDGDWIVDETIQYRSIADASALSVLGRATNSSGVLADIQAGTNDRLLTRVANVLSFTQLTSGMFPNTVVPDAALNLGQSRALSGTLAAGRSLYLVRYGEVPAGQTFEVGAGADLEIG